MWFLTRLFHDTQRQGRKILKLNQTNWMRYDTLLKRSNFVQKYNTQKISSQNSGNIASISGMLKFNCRKVIVLITRFSGIVLSPKSSLKVISNATRFIRLSSNARLLG